MENSQNYGHGPDNNLDLSNWLMLKETVKSEETVQYDVTAKWTDLIGDSQGKSIYRSSIFVNLKQTPTTSTKGPETIYGSTSHSSRPEKPSLDGKSEEEFRGSSFECSGPTETSFDSQGELSTWLMPMADSPDWKNDCDTALDWENKNEKSEWLQPMENREYVCEPSLGCNEWLAPLEPMDSLNEPGLELKSYSKWLSPHADHISTPMEPMDSMENLEHDCRPSIGYNEWLAPQIRPIFTLDKAEYGHVPYGECKSDLSQWLSPSDPWKIDQSDQGPGQAIFDVCGNLEPPKLQSTPLSSTGLNAESNLHVESLEYEIRDLKSALSRKNEEFLALEKDYEFLLNKLDESEQKRIKSESKASNTIEFANGEIEIANNYIEMLKKQVQEKDEQIHSLQKKLTSSKPKRSKMSAQSVKEKSTKVNIQKSSLEEATIFKPSSGEVEMRHTLRDGMSVSDKPDGPGLSRSDTDLNTSHTNDGKPAVKIKHYSFSSYLDKRSKADIEKCQQIRYYLNQCTDMMERLNQSSDPSDLGRVKTLEEVMQRLTENLSVLESPDHGDLQSTTK